MPSAGARELPRARYRERSRIRIAVLIAVNLIGLMAFLWPFVLPLAPGVNENHRIDGPLILVRAAAAASARCSSSSSAAAASGRRRSR